MQAALPEPSPRLLKYLDRQEDRLEGEEAAAGIAGLGLGFGLWGLLLALPYVIIRLLRRLWRFADFAADPGPR